jgi:alkanesulfonate monooxygenase SsuD/methylene tetrahydromethanopterin reductase-like flavin-dependent oxidoreductase (luciferase family)
MRFGLAYDFRNPEQWRLPWPQFYGAVLDQIVYAEQLGFDSVWLTEHHFVADGYLPAPLAIAAAIAARTSRIRIGTFILELPLYHAAQVAEQVAVIDQLSGGRIELGLGMGYREEEFRAFGVPRKQRVGRFVEGIHVLRALFGGGPVTHRGRYYELDGVQLGPPPAQLGGPPMWLGAMSVPQAQRAAALRANLMPQGDRRETYDPWHEALAASGEDSTDYRVLVNRPFMVTDDPGRAWQRLRPGEAYRAGLYAEWLNAGGQPPVRPTQPEGSAVVPVLEGRYLLGTPQHIVAEIRTYRERVPVTDLIAWGVPLGLRPDDPELMLSLEQFSQKVVPALAPRPG